MVLRSKDPGKNGWGSLLFRRLLLLKSSNFLHTLAQPPAKQRAQRYTIGVAYAGSNFVDAVAGRPEQMNSALDTQILKIRKRGFSQHLLRPAGQGSFAGCHGYGGV